MGKIVPGTGVSKYKGPGVEMGCPYSPNREQAIGPGEVPRPEEKWGRDPTKAGLVVLKATGEKLPEGVKPRNDLIYFTF